MLVSTHAPNKSVVQDATVSITWHWIKSDGTGQTATPINATPWPSLDPGIVSFIQSITVRSYVVTTGGPGSPFFVRFNVNTVPTDATAHPVDGNGQTWTELGPIYSVWLRKTVNTDLIMVEIRY